MGQSSSAETLGSYVPLPPTTHEPTNELLALLAKSSSYDDMRIRELENKINEYDFRASLKQLLPQCPSLKNPKYKPPTVTTTFLHCCMSLPVQYWEILVRAGASLEIRNHYEQTALHAAAAVGRLDIVWKFISPARLNMMDREGNTVLMVALHSVSLWLPRSSIIQDILPEAKVEQEDSTKTNAWWLKLLLQSKADPNLPNKYGDTPLLFIATSFKFRDDPATINFADTLLTYGANIGYVNYRFNQCALVGSSDNCKFLLFSWLLSRGADYRSFVERTTTAYPTPKIQLLLRFSSFVGAASETLLSIFPEKGIVHLVCSYFQLDVAALSGPKRPEELPQALF